MTTNFTLRDFFVFLLTGCCFVITMLVVFQEELLGLLQKNGYVNDFSWGWLLLLIPGIYLVGHIFGTLSYLMLCLYKWLYNSNFFKKPRRKYKHCILMFLQSVLYRQRVIYAIDVYIKSNKEIKYFKNNEEFWTTCAVLQTEKNYGSAEYWNYLNEFFNSINIVFFVSCIISFIWGHWIIGLIYLILAWLAFFRAKLYAKHFVLTVVRLMKAREQTTIKS